MCLTNEQDKIRRAILKNQLRSARTNEGQLKFRETIIRRRKKIQTLQAESVPNLIYIFPRTHISHSISSTDSDQGLEQQQLWSTYNLKSQNRKHKNYQTQTFTHPRQSTQSFKYDLPLSLPKKDDCSSRRKDGYEGRRKENSGIARKDCYQGKKKEQSGFYRKNRQQKREEVSLSNYNSRRMRQDTVNLSNYTSGKGDKTAFNSSKKLLTQQYSLVNQQVKTKKVSQAITSKKRNPSRNRVNTQHY